jgi:hypothetical protein
MSEIGQKHFFVARGVTGSFSIRINGNDNLVIVDIINF